jgi:hypothetical protein
MDLSILGTALGVPLLDVLTVLFPPLAVPLGVAAAAPARLRSKILRQ